MASRGVRSRFNSKIARLPSSSMPNRSTRPRSGATTSRPIISNSSPRSWGCWAIQFWIMFSFASFPADIGTGASLDSLYNLVIWTFPASFPPPTDHSPKLRSTGAARKRGGCDVQCSRLHKNSLSRLSGDDHRKWQVVEVRLSSFVT
jgi:hypothetical protein